MCKKRIKREVRKVVIPGFEAVFAIAGLLAVTYLIRRKKAIRRSEGWGAKRK